uniref:ER membrane protein complex subunit 1 n=1 Tax=Rhizophora mucronata TaxID=61149 RepID=A0A2P2LC42_RHIMU
MCVTANYLCCNGIFYFSELYVLQIECRTTKMSGSLFLESIICLRPFLCTLDQMS